FVRQHMGLPDNGSYHDYVEVKRPYVVWNVIAAEPYSVKAKTWCYPIAGCVSYRGYYDKADARAYASELKQQGLDVAISGASAYSTLGWMDDPLLSTMLNRSEARLVEVIIHELAHQRFYLADQTQINESFASAVALEGVRRWYQQKGDDAAYQEFLQARQLRREFNQLLLATRQELASHYAQVMDSTKRQQGKERIFSRLQDEYQQFSKRHGDHRYDRWMSQGLNNAHLAQVAAYNQLEPLFTKMIRQADGDMQAFYRQLEAMSEVEFMRLKE
ncbi:MAG: aminopeptidase, partial [Gammaproteobacteria bacterium]|nr:aminopeptidase [Gammaproteobacteria bacterium]